MEQSYAQSLEAKHEVLAQKIETEEQRPHPDDILIHQLKKEKLAIRDALALH